MIDPKAVSFHLFLFFPLSTFNEDTNEEIGGGDDFDSEPKVPHTLLLLGG